MTTTKTTIELNGQLYDARTGRIIGLPVLKPAENKPPNHTSSGTSVDGFVRRPHTTTYATVDTPTVKTRPQTVRSQPAQAKAKLDKSRTLMRPAVKKPKALVSHEVKPQAVTKKLDTARHARAAATPKSDIIQRFHKGETRHVIVKREAPLPVASQSTVASHRIATQVAHLATSTETQVKQSVDLIEESLRNASAHLEKFEDKVIKRSFLNRVGFGNKAANLGSLSFAGLLLVGFFAYQNVPNVQMRLASAQAGVSARMPGYSPAGFGAINNVKSEPGKVTVTFRSHTDDKKFTVTQQASNWSSDSLLNNHVATSQRPYQTYQDEGKTVYISDNSSATWVNGGIWYRVDGDATLSSDQLLRIASSL